MSASVGVDADDPTPPFEQLRRQFAGLIVSGALPEGTRLAPVRRLAADLGLANGTVARAYRALEVDGLVRTRRGGGTSVAAPRTLTEAELAGLLDRLAARFVEETGLLGAEPADVQAAVERAFTVRTDERN